VPWEKRHALVGGREYAVNGTLSACKNGEPCELSLRCVVERT